MYIVDAMITCSCLYREIIEFNISLWFIKKIFVNQSASSNSDCIKQKMAEHICEWLRLRSDFAHAKKFLYFK